MYPRVIIVSLLVLAAFGGCKKNSLPPEETSEEPVFYVKANIDGSAVEYKAGQDGYYMNAAHSQNADNVYVYEGDLSQKTCTGTCGWNFDIQINDYTVSAVGAAMNPNEGLKPASYDFNDLNLQPMGYMGSFAPSFSTVSIYTNKWTFSDGGVDIFQFPSGTTHYFKNGTTHTVNLRVELYNNPNVNAELSNVYNIGSPLQAFLKVDNLGQGNFAFNVVSTGSPANYFWEYGDGTVSTVQPLPTMNHSYSATSTYTARCKVTGTNGEVCYTNAFVNNSGGVIDANYSSSFTPVPNTKKLSAITIRVTDPATGKVFTSADMDQPASSKFEIVSVESYKENNSGDPTKKVTIRFNCVVKNGTETKTISNGEAVIAVSYK